MELVISGNILRIRLGFWDKLSAVHGSLTIALEDIETTSTDKPVSSWRDLRAPGTHLPGVIKVGTYFTRRGREFWHWTRKKPFLTIELKRGFYKRVILGIEDNEYWASKIKST